MQRFRRFVVLGIAVLASIGATAPAGGWCYPEPPDLICGARCIQLYCWYDQQSPTTGCIQVAGGTGCMSMDNHPCCTPDGLF